VVVPPVILLLRKGQFRLFLFTFSLRPVERHGLGGAWRLRGDRRFAARYEAFLASLFMEGLPPCHGDERAGVPFLALPVPLVPLFPKP
jgi:hypothetical protein